MEKEICNNPEHHSTCGWCGLDKHFSWKRLALAILLGLFIFCLGIQIGEMRNAYRNQEYGHMILRQNMMYRYQTDPEMMQLTLPASTTSTTATPATTTVTVKKAQ